MYYFPLALSEGVSFRACLLPYAKRYPLGLASCLETITLNRKEINQNDYTFKEKVCNLAVC